MVQAESSVNEYLNVYFECVLKKLPFFHVRDIGARAYVQNYPMNTWCIEAKQ